MPPPVNRCPFFFSLIRHHPESQILRHNKIFAVNWTVFVKYFVFNEIVKNKRVSECRKFNSVSRSLSFDGGVELIKKFKDEVVVGTEDVLKYYFLLFSLFDTQHKFT